MPGTSACPHRRARGTARARPCIRLLFATCTPSVPHGSAPGCRGTTPGITIILTDQRQRESPLCEPRRASVSVLSLSRRAHASNRRRYIFSSPKVPHERSTRVVHCVESRDAYIESCTSYKTQTATRESILQSAAQGSSSAARNLVLGVGRVPASPGARSSERLRANRMPRLTSSVSGMRALM